MPTGAGSTTAAENVTSWSDLELAMVSAGIPVSELTDLTDEQKAKLLELENELLKAGDSLSNYGSLNAAQLAQIAAAWNGNVAEIQKAIKGIQAATNEANRGPTKPDSDEVKAYQKKHGKRSYGGAEAT